jgi:hypothetical protein
MPELDCSSWAAWPKEAHRARREDARAAQRLPSRGVKHCFCGCGRRIPRFPLDLRGLNERGRLISERLAWALGLGVAPAPGASASGAHSAVEAGANRASWADEGAAHIAQLRDAMHGVRNADSISETTSDRWQTEGLYLEYLAVSKNGHPSISAWLEDHPDAGRELARSVPDAPSGHEG